MSEITNGAAVPSPAAPTVEGLVALRAYPSPEAGELALGLLQASGVRGLLLRRIDGSALVAVHSRDERAAECILGAVPGAGAHHGPDGPGGY